MTAYNEWVTAHASAANALASAMSIDAFNGVREVINGLMEAPDFTPAGHEDTLAQVVTTGVRALTKQREEPRP